MGKEITPAEIIEKFTAAQMAAKFKPPGLEPEGYPPYYTSDSVTEPLEETKDT